MSNKLQSVLVKFKDSRLNYRTSVSHTSTLESLTKYFVGQSFDMGSFPDENMKQCIGIELNPE
jgi:hypothetical protein